MTFGNEASHLRKFLLSFWFKLLRNSIQGTCETYLETLYACYTHLVHPISMCSQIVQRYSKCRCLLRVLTAPCANARNGEKCCWLKGKTVLVGLWCSNHETQVPIVENGKLRSTLMLETLIYRYVGPIAQIRSTNDTARLSQQVNQQHSEGLETGVPSQPYSHSSDYEILTEWQATSIKSGTSFQRVSGGEERFMDIDSAHIRNFEDNPSLDGLSDSGGCSGDPNAETVPFSDSGFHISHSDDESILSVSHTSNPECKTVSRRMIKVYKVSEKGVFQSVNSKALEPGVIHLISILWNALRQFSIVGSGVPYAIYRSYQVYKSWIKSRYWPELSSQATRLQWTCVRFPEPGKFNFSYRCLTNIGLRCDAVRGLCYDRSCGDRKAYISTQSTIPHIPRMCKNTGQAEYGVIECSNIIIWRWELFKFDSPPYFIRRGSISMPGLFWAALQSLRQKTFQKVSRSMYQHRPFPYNSWRDRCDKYLSRRYDFPHDQRALSGSSRLPC